MITLEELLDWTKAETEDSDLLEDLLEAAIAHVESATGMKWSTGAEVTQSMTFNGWPLALQGTPTTGEDFTLEQWTGETWETVEADRYYLDGAFIRPAGNWTITGANPWPRFRATYTTGYVEGLQPAPVRLAVRLLVQAWYDGAEGEALEAVTRTVDLILAPYRRVTV